MEIKLDKVSYSYNVNTKLEKTVFDNISASFKSKNITAIIGKSGSGKTTLLELLAGLIKPVDGKVVLTNKKIGLMFKVTDEQFLKRTVKQELELVLSNKEKGSKRISSVLKQVGLNDTYLDKNPLKLSQSEKFKVSLASLLLYNSSVMLLDEPTVCLTDKNKVELIKILKSLKNKTIIIASNDVEFVHRIADYIYVIDNGKICFEGTKYDVFMNPKYYNRFNNPKIIDFILKVHDRGIDLEKRDDIKDLMKDVYRHVTK